MDPYLEHPVIWESVHARLINALAEQLQPLIEPRYVTSIEERVFVEGPQRRIPDVWLKKSPVSAGQVAAASPHKRAAIVEIEPLEVREGRIEILDATAELRLVTVIELASPTNKHRGPGRRSYRKKQKEILRSDCHLVEIDLHRTGRHVLSVPHWRVLQEFPQYDYLACVNRAPARHRFELYPMRLREPLGVIDIPLASPDPDVPLDLQAAMNRVYRFGRYDLRGIHDRPCIPPLSAEDQAWASEQWAKYKAAHPEWFGPEPQQAE
jgi:hypothetical protein